MEAQQFCYACGAPTNHPDFKGPVENYCKYCVDEKGTLKPKDEVKKGMAQWLQTWQPDLDEENALKRAEHYMQAMPAWAN